MRLNFTQRFQNVTDKRQRRGTTIIELMMVVLVMTLLLTAVYNIFRGGQKGVQEAVKNHIINEEAQKVIDNLANDIRESNQVHKDFPQMVDEPAIAGLTSADPKNKMEFYKYTFDFTKDLKTLPAGTTYYNQTKITYSLDKDPPKTATCPYVLYREEIPYDATGNEIAGKRFKKHLAVNIKDFVFYRITPLAGDSRGKGPNNVYVKFTLARMDKDPNAPRYSSELTSCVRVRGSKPE